MLLLTASSSLILKLNKDAFVERQLPKSHTK
jgi:hypothetical protein